MNNLHLQRPAMGDARPAADFLHDLRAIVFDACGDATIDPPHRARQARPAEAVASANFQRRGSGGLVFR
jgi:hypothetical protein